MMTEDGYGEAACPECGGLVQVWPDNSGGITVNFACSNASCASGKGPWDFTLLPVEPLS